MENIQDLELLRLIVFVMAAVMTLLISVVGFIAKWAIGSMLTKMDEFLDEVRNLTSTTIKLDGRISPLESSEKNHTERLNQHGSKIQTLDMKISTCQAKNHVAV